MSITKFLAIIALFGTIAVACKKKDTPSTPTKTEKGFWTGKKSYGSSSPATTNVAFVLEDGGRLKYFLGFQNTDTAIAPVKSTGVYEFNNNILKATVYRPASPGIVQFSYTATANSAIEKFENGTWGQGNSFTDNGGIFYLDKKN